MTGNEFVRRLRKLGRQDGIHVVYRQDEGPGSHGTIYYGQRRTTLKDPRKEIGRGLLRKMCQDLGIDPSRL
jgi:mRNA interferase HicA